MSEIKADVCICTRNRPDDLMKCIESVMRSQVEVNSIIVSDDSTDDKTEVLIKRNFPGVRFIKGPRRGLGANRNSAISAVEGDFVIFLDDDAVLDRYFISSAGEFAEKYSLDLKNTILTGYEINNGEQIRSNDQDFLGFQRRRYSEKDVLNTITINSALIPSEVAKEIMFDELLVYGSDEVDFAVRARAANVQIAFCPHLKNLHFPSTINRDYYRPFTDASRIYITFKRYRLLEKSHFKAWFFLIVASLHLVAANLRRSGVRGLVVAWTSLQKAFAYKKQYLAQQNSARLRSSS